MTSPSDAILVEWANRSHHIGRGFVEDGIIDSARWANAPRKVLFLLKEAYSEPHAPVDWDLRAKIRDDWRGPKHQIWWNVSEWALTLQHTSTKGSPDFFDNRQGHAELVESLLSSAVVNVKKSSGKKNSDDLDLRDFVSRDKDLIHQQIREIRPDLVLCGSTWPLVAHLWPEAQRIHERIVVVDGVAFIDFYHPANRYPRCLNYYALSFLMQHYLNVSARGIPVN